MPRTIRVWDAPTRIFHWGLALAVLFAWGATRWHNYSAHRAAGYVVLGLIVFRLIWGFAGSETSRFSTFLGGPAGVWRYARTLPARASAAAYGHNPIGAWSVVAMLLALVVQVGLGLFAVDTDGLESGPLSDHVSFDAGRWAAKLHHRSFSVLLALIALHIAAVLFYALWKRRDLVRSMFTGRMAAAEREPGAFVGSGRAVVAAIVAAAVAWWVSRGMRL